MRDASSVIFAISDDEVSFGAFARLFRERLKCSNALFDGGTVPSLYSPMLQRGGNLCRSSLSACTSELIEAMVRKAFVNLAPPSKKAVGEQSHGRQLLLRTSLIKSERARAFGLATLSRRQKNIYLNAVVAPSMTSPIPSPMIATNPTT